MNKKRTRLEIIKDILEVIKQKSGRIKPTHILYKSNLSHGMMETYLKELQEKEFITEQKTKTGRTYLITQKGQEYLSQYQTIAQFTSSFGLNE
jgi:predicted transcriptional regulator